MGEVIVGGGCAMADYEAVIIGTGWAGVAAIRKVISERAAAHIRGRRTGELTGS